MALPETLVDEALAALGGFAVSVATYRPASVGVISTLLPGLKPSVVDKTLRVMEERLAPTGASLSAEMRVPHERSRWLRRSQRWRQGLPRSSSIFGASAITDRRDVIPQALLAAGGRIEHLGMPVDPGNLLLIGELAGKPVIGAPGCARSPKENGFDWVLQRCSRAFRSSRAISRRWASAVC
jgi:molybdenum cofactor cytidylyltransferase